MSVDTGKAQTMVVTSLAISATLVIVQDAAQGQLPAARLAIGVTFAGVALSTLAELDPALAYAFALLVLTSAVFVYGGPAFQAIASATATAPPPVPAPSVKIA